MSRPRLWWCNADFDLTLAHGGGKLPAKILEAARGMAWHLWPALRPEDVLVVSEPPPEGFPEALAQQGLAPPRFVTDAEVDAAVRANPRLLFTPFGWNVEGARRNSRMPFPAEHPDLEVVRHVNSRAFSLELEQRLFPESACPAVFCPDRDSVARWLSTAKPGAYVAKGNHGHAGIGQSRVVLPADEAGAEATLARLCARHAGVVIESRQEIHGEWGILFRLARDGARSEVRIHRLLTGERGGYAGALVQPGSDTLPGAMQNVALAAVDAVAGALHREGYFGPVGLDMYAHPQEGRLRFRPLVDLNVRISMAFPVHGIAARFPGQTVLYLQASSRSLQKIRTSRSDYLRIDEMSIDLRAPRGVIRLSPQLSFPKRASLALVGESKADVLALLCMLKLDPIQS